MCSNQHAPNLLIKPLQNYQRIEFWFLLPSTVNASTLHTNPWTLLCFTNYNHQTKVRIKQHSNANTCKLKTAELAETSIVISAIQFSTTKASLLQWHSVCVLSQNNQNNAKEKASSQLFNNFLPHHYLLPQNSWSSKV